MGTAMTPRLRAIVAQVQPVESAIDVGCDHAQVGIWLTQHNIVKKMTVSDINEGPILLSLIHISDHPSFESLLIRERYS